MKELQEPKQPKEQERSTQRDSMQSLTPDQRRLVKENLGLVGVHLKRFVPGLATPHRHREWEDLFQEGCLGLIRAALLFREERGIPFAAFALPRIHNAVSRALRERFKNVGLPPRRRPSCREDEPLGNRSDPRSAPSECRSSGVREPGGTASDRHQPDAEQARAQDTIGQRLRTKYERAVRRARRRMVERASARGDREYLLDLLERERFMIPQEESRRPLRQIARDTNSSFSRVAHCHKRMSELIRQLLEEDAEFRALRRRAKHSPHGGDEFVDAAMEAELADACADQFAHNFRQADSENRGRMLASLLETSRQDIECLIRQAFRQVRPADRACIMDHADNSIT